MKRFAAFVLCLVMVCSCISLQCFADDSEQPESATVIVLEAPLCLDYATINEFVELVDDSGDYVKVKSADGVEGYADARWLLIFSQAGKAQVLSERVEIFAEMLKQGDTVEVLERGDEFTKVKVNDIEGEVETRFLRFEDEDEYQTWTCYSAPDTLVFNNPWLRFDKHEQPVSAPNTTWVAVNTELTVLADLGSAYYVKNDSAEGYIAKEDALESWVDYSLWGNTEPDDGSHERQTLPQWLIEQEITIGKRFPDGTLNPDWVDPSN